MINKAEIDETYDNRLLLFADIMGFSDFIEQTLNKPELVPYAHNLFNKTSKMLENIKSLKLNQLEVDQTKLTCRMFSDNITVSIPYVSEDDLILITSWACILQYTIYSNTDFFLRGSIVHSKLFDRENKIFGPALIEAYNFERKKAGWQRIIFHDSLIRLNNEPNPYFDYYIEEEAGIYYLDYLRYLFRLLGINEYRGINKSADFRKELPGSIELFQGHKRKIKLAMSRVYDSSCSSAEKEKRITKYNKLSAYHNSVLESFCSILEGLLSDKDLIHDICISVFKQSYLELLGDFSFKSPYTIENIKYKEIIPLFFIAVKGFILDSTLPQTTHPIGVTIDELINESANEFFKYSLSNLKTFKNTLYRLRIS